MTPEELALLFGAARPGGVTGLPAAGVDWTRLVHLAERERATAPLWQALVAADPGLASRPGTTMLRQCAMVQGFRMQALAARVEAGLLALERRGIRALLLKGAAVAVRRRAPFAARPMGDVDLLVAERDGVAAIEALAGAGWSPKQGDTDLAMYDDHHHLPPLVHADDATLRLEVHTDVVLPGHPLAFGAGELWEGAAEGRLGRAPAFVPEAVPLLLHACVHLAWSHVMAGGLWRFCHDVAHLTGEGFDWDAFVASARRARAGSLAFWPLELAAEVGGVAVPGAVRGRLRPRLPSAVLPPIRRHFATVALRGGEAVPSIRLRRWLWSLGMRPGAEGHGRARPWDRDAEFTLARAAVGALTAAEREAMRVGRASPLAQVRSAGGYLRRLLSGDVLAR